VISIFILLCAIAVLMFTILWVLDWDAPQRTERTTSSLPRGIAIPTCWRKKGAQ
jgi:hypothetical protein